MSANTDTDGYTLTELRRMDEAEAKRSLTYGEYQRWESLNKHLDDAEEVRQEWSEIDESATDMMVFADRTDLAVEVSAMGNDLLVYYGPTDEAIRAPAERLTDRYDLGENSTLEADDVPDEDLKFVETALADLITAAVVKWNGTHWDDLSPRQREGIHDQIIERWGVAGLMDVWVDIQVSVEDNRNERLERIEKFRNPERRGGR